MRKPKLKAKPSAKELELWMNETLQHCCRVEWYANRLGVGHDDPERPHDITGTGNKFALPVMEGLALQFRRKGNLSWQFRSKYILPAVEKHRVQHHHQMWNGPDPYATEDEMQFGALDSLCCMMEDRVWNRAFTPNEVFKAIWENSNWDKITYLVSMYRKMDKLKYCPRFESLNIRNFDKLYLPRKHLPNETRKIIIERVDGTREMLNRNGYQL